MSRAQELSTRLAAIEAKTPAQRERLQEVLERAESPAVLCAFHATNPASGTIGQCIGEATHTAVVALVVPPPFLEFRGDGVEVLVCAAHAAKLTEVYGAVAE